MSAYIILWKRSKKLPDRLVLPATIFPMYLQKQVTMRVALTPELLKEKIANIGGAVTIAYPMGLPEWDPVPHILKDKDEVAGADFKKILVD